MTIKYELRTALKRQQSWFIEIEGNQYRVLFHKLFNYPWTKNQFSNKYSLSSFIATHNEVKYLTIESFIADNFADFL